MQYHHRPYEPAIDLSAITPTHRELVSGYAVYLELLGEALESQERSEELQAQIRGLRSPDYLNRIPELALVEELGRVLGRISKIAPSTHALSSEDIFPIRQLAAKDLGDAEPNELFLKLCAFERVLNRHRDIFGDLRATDAIPISELQSYAKEDLCPLTAMELQYCVSLAHAAREVALAAAERRRNTRDDSVAECSAALLEEIERQPAMQLKLKSQAAVVRSKLEAFNAWALATYQASEPRHHIISPTSDPHLIKPYLEWRYRTLMDLETATRPGSILSGAHLIASLEGKLGEGSRVNHFVVFLLGSQGSPVFYSHFHEPLNMLILLAIANPSCDALVYQGAVGTLSVSRLSRGIDFIVPALKGVVEIPKVESSMSCQGRIPDL